MKKIAAVVLLLQVSAIICTHQDPNELVTETDEASLAAAPTHEGKEEDPIIRNKQSCKGTSGNLVSANSVKHMFVDHSRSGKLLRMQLSLIQEVETVIFKNTNFFYMVSTMFNNREIRTVRMEQVLVPVLDNRYLTGSKKLENMFLINVRASNGIDDKLFANMPSLKKVYIKHTDIKAISEKFVQGTKTLEHLLINSAKVKTVSSDAFKDTTNLKTINLENNEISSIKEGTFNNLNNLRILDLSHNQISTMTSVELPKLPALEILDLSVNTINDFVFTDLIQRFPKLKYLNITNTPIPQKSIENLLQAAAANHFSVSIGGDMMFIKQNDIVLD